MGFPVVACVGVLPGSESESGRLVFFLGLVPGGVNRGGLPVLSASVRNTGTRPRAAPARNEGSRQKDLALIHG